MLFKRVSLWLFREKSWATLPRLFTVVAFAGAYATEPLFQAGVFQNYDLDAIEQALFRRLLECLCVALVIFATVALVEIRPPRQVAFYSVALVAAVTAGSAVGCTFWGIAVFGSRFFDASTYLIGETARFAVLGGILTLVDGFSRRMRTARAADRELHAANATLEAQSELSKLRLLEAQIEPHFLFNTIANLRRTWRVDPVLGQRMHDNVIRYMAAALPHMRSPVGTLGEEVELTRAYLELFSIRMGERLTFSIEACDSVLAETFPRMVLLTLVENAIKHGLAPAAKGGHVAVVAKAEDSQLLVSVSDDGVGFGAAATGGTGIGLANIRARLLTAYGREARLDVGSGPVAGVVATICLPLSTPAATGAVVPPQISGRGARLFADPLARCQVA